MTIGTVRITPAHLWFGAALIGFLPVAWLDQAWLGPPAPGAAPLTRSERAQEPWPLLVTIYLLACGGGCFATTVRSMERDLGPAPGRPRAWIPGGLVANLGRAARVGFFMGVYGVLLLFGAVLLGGSIARAVRRPNWPDGWSAGAVGWGILTAYLGLGTYWWRRLSVVLLLKRWGDADPEPPARKPPPPRGPWDPHLDEV